MKKICLTIMFLIIAVISVSAQAEEPANNGSDFTDETKIILDTQADANEAAPEEDESFFTTWDFVRLILILLAVILVIYIIFYFMRKAGGPKFRNEDLIRLLGSQSLTQNSSVHLIEVGNKYYLVGCGESTVTHIADVDDKETVDEIILRNPPPSEGRKNFADFFNIKTGRKDAFRGNIRDKIKNNNKFMHDQAERLKKM